MTNALVDCSALPQSSVPSDYTKQTSFLARLQLYSKQECVTEGKIGAGRFGVPDGEKIRDLGAFVDVIVLGVRPKALDYSDPKGVKIYYEDATPEFQAIKASASEKHAWGPSYLLFVRQLDDFAEFFLSSKSSRPVGEDLAPYLPGQALQGQPCTLEPDLVRSKKYNTAWHIPKVVPCSQPFASGPSMERIKHEVALFLNVRDPKPTEAPSRAR